jgi:hypothetical protein
MFSSGRWSPEFQRLQVSTSTPCQRLPHPFPSPTHFTHIFSESKSNQKASSVQCTASKPTPPSAPSSLTALIVLVVLLHCASQAQGDAMIDVQLDLQIRAVHLWDIVRGDTFNARLSKQLTGFARKARAWSNAANRYNRTSSNFS